MGGAWSSEEPAADLENDITFWTKTVEMGLTGLPRVAIGPFQCNLPALKNALRRTSTDYTLLTRQRANHRGVPLPSPPLAGTMLQYAEAFMLWDPELGRARKKLVPVSVKEDVFWANYMDAVRVHILLFFLHYPSTVGAYFDMAHELLDRIAWLPVQLNIQRAVSCEDDTPGSQRF